jgi:hypothetical protein
VHYSCICDSAGVYKPTVPSDTGTYDTHNCVRGTVLENDNDPCVTGLCISCTVAGYFRVYFFYLQKQSLAYKSLPSLSCSSLVIPWPLLLLRHFVLCLVSSHTVSFMGAYLRCCGLHMWTVYAQHVMFSQWWNGLMTQFSEPSPSLSNT